MIAVKTVNGIFGITCFNNVLVIAILFCAKPLFVHGVQYANVENTLTSSKTNTLHSGRECQGGGLKSETRPSLRSRRDVGRRRKRWANEWRTCELRNGKGDLEEEISGGGELRCFFEGEEYNYPNTLIF